ncbi:hypothetical protein HD554DRAFT_2081847 [Boletus coccyginus]|nr:hypothetical protein HD554DRAFT_2081847 [Boletus coccyginus]
MMEVDMQSPPSTFRTVAFTIKRPRSPGSPTQERQTKRLLLAPVGLEGQCVRRTSTASDGVADGRMASQDDWVRQARELSITSPLSVTAGFPFAMDGHGTVAHGRVDEHMAIDCEDSHLHRVLGHPGSSRPWTTMRSHLPVIHITTTPPQTPVPVPSGLHAPSPAPFSVLTEPPSSPAESSSSTSPIPVPQTSVGTSAPHLCPPDIFLFPATPSDTPSLQHQFTADCEQHPVESGPGPHVRMQGQRLSQSSLTRTQDRADGSPRPSKVPDLPTSSGRKHRVTMGPRADCVKCRTGVRGHWMHFD